MLIDEFKFPHAVIQLTPNDMNAQGLQYCYKKLSQFLNLMTTPEVGITLIVTPNWMYLSTIHRPYHLETLMNIPGANLEDGVPLYLDGFAYSGILNMQHIIQKWPGTSGN